jgi:hypothetical protein
VAKGSADGDRVLVVCDVNIFVDVAELVGEPFSWGKFERLAAERANDPLPHKSNAAYDSLRALGCLVGGTLPDGRPVEVWTSDNIDYSVALKLSQSPTAPHPDDRGHGWSKLNAQAVVDQLVRTIVERTSGGSTGFHEVAYGPPLDHEDGCVYATVTEAGHSDAPYYERYCLTRDEPFQKADLRGLIDRMAPHTWVQKHRALSHSVTFAAMLRSSRAVTRANQL